MSTPPVLGDIVIGVAGVEATTGVEVLTLDTPIVERSAQETPVTVEVRTCPDVPVAAPSQSDPLKSIAAVEDVIPTALKALFPLHVFLAAEFIA
jgi:hypothetical protein